MNEKIKFATKAALSLTLAFLIPFALGWPQASTAATTVMLIASTGGTRESLAKGTLRLLGTLAGAVLGLLLVGWFAQDRLLYMLTVSVVVAFIFYFRNAYQKDPTLFMLTGVTTLMMANGGDAEGAFIYGVDRAYMTMFGIVIYTLVGTFLFPTKTEQNLRKLSDKLNEAQRQLFHAIINNLRIKTQLSTHQDAQYNAGSPPINTDKSDTSSEDISELIDNVFNAQSALEQHFYTVSHECSEISAYLKEWQLTLHYYQSISQQLVITAQSHFIHPEDRALLSNFDESIAAIDALFHASQTAWDSQGTPYRTDSHQTTYNQDALTNASHVEKGSALTLGYVINQLHENLSRLTETISCIDSVTNRISFDPPLQRKAERFLWWDAENCKTAIKVFVTYWVAGAVWIYLNPPGGYQFVAFSTIYMSLLSFVPVHPVMLLVLFTFGFLFAVPSYVFVLPQLELPAELGAFIFIYAFVGFYLFKGPVTIFFLLGLFILGLNNQMTYNFSIIMTIMMLFYMVVFMIIFSHYFPFSSRPEHLFVTLKERYFRHVNALFTAYQTQKNDWYSSTIRSLHLKTLTTSGSKLQMWGTKLNHKLFSTITPESVKAFTDACQVLSSHLKIMIQAEHQLQDNRLLRELRSGNRDDILPAMALALARDHHTSDLNHRFDTFDAEYQEFETRLEQFFTDLDFTDYAYSEIAGFYILLNLKRNVYEALKQCKATYEDIDWVNLKQKRF